MECIHAFKVLRSLRIWCALRKPIFSIWDEGAVGMLQSILKCVQSGSALHTVDIDVGRGLGGGHVYSSYLAPDCQDAHRFLRDLCGPNMLNTLEGFTGLHRLRVNLELEEKDLHDDSWWTTEVLRLLPPESPLRAVISVTASLIKVCFQASRVITIRTDVYFSSTFRNTGGLRIRLIRTNPISRGHHKRPTHC